MRIYLGKNSGQHSIASFSSKRSLFKKDDVFISSDESPLIRMSLSKGRFLFIWGQVDAIYTSSNKIVKFELPQGETILRKMISQSSVKDIIRKLEGHFAAVLVNSEQEIFIFGDIYNRRDIFYTLDGNSLVASTDLNAVVGACQSKRYHQESLINIFNVYGNYTPKRHTIYEGIYRLAVGERIEYKKGKIAVEAFRFDPVPIGNYGDAQLNEYSRLLHSAVEVRSSEKCNWVALSSGWDSSTILALLVKYHGPSKIRAFISRCKYSENPGIINQFEVDRAKKIADYFSVPLDIVDTDYTKEEYLNFWQEKRDFLRANHLYSLWSYDFFKMAEHVSKNSHAKDPFFNGETSDGAHNLGFAQFATILNHPDLGFREYSDKMASYLFGPSFFSRIMRGDSPYDDCIYNFLRSRMQGRTFEDSAKMDVRQRKMKFLASFFLSNQRIPFISVSNAKLFTSLGRQRYESVMCETYFSDFADRGEANSLYSWFLHLYNSFHWQGNTVKGLLMSANYYNRAVGMPFWDSRIQLFLSAMPESWGRGLDIRPTKYPLKWMLKNKVNYPYHLQVGPHSYLYDVDPDWSVDSDILYGSAGKSYFKKILKKYQYEEVLYESHFNLQYLRKLVDGYVKGAKVSGQELNDLKNLVSLSLVGWF
jgi:hypothetical protein